MRVYINSRLFSMLYDQNRGALAVFVIMSAKFPHKRTNISLVAKECGVGITTIKKHLAALRRLNLVSKEGIILKSNKSIDEMFGSTKKVFFVDTESYKSVKDNIETLILTSNKFRQEKAIRIKDNIRRIKSRIEKGKYVTKADLRFLKSKEKKYSSDIQVANLSNSKICSLLGVKTYQTALRRKQKASRINLNFFRRYHKIGYLTRQEFNYAKKFEEIKPYSKLMNGVAFEDLASGMGYGEVENEYKYLFLD